MPGGVELIRWRRAFYPNDFCIFPLDSPPGMPHYATYEDDASRRITSRYLSPLRTPMDSALDESMALSTVLESSHPQTTVIVVRVRLRPCWRALTSQKRYYVKFQLNLSFASDAWHQGRRGKLTVWTQQCNHCGARILGPPMVMFVLDGKEIHIRINPSDFNMGEDHKDFCPDCLLAAAKKLARSFTWDEVKAAVKPKES